MTIDARGAIWRGNNQERRENLCAPPSVWLYGFNLIWSYVLVIRLSTVICRRVLEERTPLGGVKPRGFPVVRKPSHGADGVFSTKQMWPELA